MNSPAGVTADTISIGVEAGTGTRQADTGRAGHRPGRLAWERSGEGDGSIEIAFPLSVRWARGDWVLMRVAGDPAGRVLVFDRNEWECFIDGARNGEFDDAAASVSPIRSDIHRRWSDLPVVPGRRARSVARPGTSGCRFVPLSSSEDLRHRS